MPFVMERFISKRMFHGFSTSKHRNKSRFLNFKLMYVDGKEAKNRRKKQKISGNHQEIGYTFSHYSK